MKVEYLPIDIVKHNPQNVRSGDEDIDDIRALAENINQIGLISPISVKLLPDGSYIVVAGNRRLSALRMLGWKTVPAFVIDDEENAVKVMVAENIARKDLAPVEICTIIRTLVDEYSLSLREIATTLGRSLSYVNTYYSLAYAPDDVMRYLHKNTIPIGVLVHLAEIDDDTTRQNFLEYAEKYGISVAEAKRMKEYYSLNKEELPSYITKEKMPEIFTQATLILVQCSGCGKEVDIAQSSVVRLCKECIEVWNQREED